MLRKTTSKLFTTPSLFTPYRTIISFNQTLIQKPNNLQQMLDFFDKKDASNNRLCVIHFTADWNPKCKTVLEEYKEFAVRNSKFTHFVVDTEEHQKIRLYFGARYQPQFLVLYDGAVVNRMIGYDMNRLQNVLDRVNDFHLRRDDNAPGVEDERQNYYDEHDREASIIERGRDVFDTCFEPLEKQYLTTK